MRGARNGGDLRIAAAELTVKVYVNGNEVVFDEAFFY